MTRIETSLRFQKLGVDDWRRLRSGKVVSIEPGVLWRFGMAADSCFVIQEFVEHGARQWQSIAIQRWDFTR